MYVGVDYYPEHWQKERWATDAKLMKEAGFNVVRLAEFAWVMMEPDEGRFTFDWLDEAIAVLGAQGISCILGTPTGSMPAWVARKYPDVLALLKDGTRKVWGVRKDNCLTSPTYRLLSERIACAMAEHYADHRHVIGWQTDNEFGGIACHCETCRNEFIDYLRKKHGSLDSLNASWGTHFWGHRVGTWNEVVLPNEKESHNPGACLDWQRFFSACNIRLQAEQVRILRARCPKHFITHNLMGCYPEIDYFTFARDLDFVSWDNYPVWNDPGFRYRASMAADLMRGLKKKNFWIMEQTAGPGGWGAFGRNPWPGEIRGVAYQQLAHGADGQIWFRWRTCTAGREQYWHGLLGHDGRALRRYEEAKKTAHEYHALAPMVEGTTVEAKVAIVHDYDALWALRIQPGYDGCNYHDAIARYYEALLRAGVNVDFVSPADDLSSYRVVFAPHLHVLSDDTAARLHAFVERGGVLVADCRTAVKTPDNLCRPETLPGPLSAALGIEIQEYESLGEKTTYPIELAKEIGGFATATRYCDWITPKGAESLGTFGAPHMRGYAPVTRHKLGKGRGYYVGTIAKEESFYDGVVKLVLADAGVRPLMTPPEGVELSVRKGGGRTLAFFVNHAIETRTVALPSPKRDLLDGKTKHSLDLPPFGATVVLWE
jgi:beta-galactosidase